MDNLPIDFGGYGCYNVSVKNKAQFTYILKR